jgi:hypothetical protein
MGKEFLVKFVSKYQWKLEGETRVGGYNCFKATTVRPASKTDFRNFRPKKEDPAAVNGAKTNFMDNLEMPGCDYNSLVYT